MAMRFNLDASGFKKIEAEVTDVLESTAKAVAKDARANAPVDTGRLRGSITTEMDGDTAIVRATAPYAVYVELGTSRAAAQPFLKPALYTKRSGGK